MNSQYLEVGDVLYVLKAFGIKHYAIVVGRDLVLQNIRGRGECLTTLYDFARGQRVHVVRTGAAPEPILARAREVMRQPQSYNLLTNNCEHTVTRILAGKPESPQLAQAILAGVGVLLFAALASR